MISFAEFALSLVGLLICAVLFLGCAIVVLGILHWLFTKEDPDFEVEVDENPPLEYTDNSEYDWGHDVRNEEDE